MATKAAPEKVLRLALQVALAVALIAVVAAVMFYMQLGDLQGQLAQAQQTSADASSAGGKAAAELKTLKTKMADADKKAAESEKPRAALARIEPQLIPMLEAAAGAKTAKPVDRANALAAAGIVAQVIHGAGDQAALSLLDRALAQDKSHCLAGLAMNLSGTKQVALEANCEPLALPASATGTMPAGASPGAAPAAAPAATPATAPAAPASPAAPAGKAPEPAAKN